MLRIARSTWRPVTCWCALKLCCIVNSAYFNTRFRFMFAPFFLLLFSKCIHSAEGWLSLLQCHWVHASCCYYRPVDCRHAARIQNSQIALLPPPPGAIGCAGDEIPRERTPLRTDAPFEGGENGGLPSWLGWWPCMLLHRQVTDVYIMIRLSRKAHWVIP